MGCQQLHTHARHFEKNSQHCSCDCCSHLASEGIWSFQLPYEYTCVNNTSWSNPGFVHISAVLITVEILLRNTAFIAMAKFKNTKS
jgi:hypothetical protein